MAFERIRWIAWSDENGMQTDGTSAWKEIVF